jgi:ATP synthase I subunit
MTAKELAKIERWNYLIAGVLVLVAALLFDSRAVVGAAVGGILACANFAGVRRIVAASLRAGGTRRAALQLLLIGKMGLLFLLVALALRFLPMSPVFFAIGMSVFLISIAIESVRHALTAHDVDEVEDDGRA